jgi:hypothetical protein
MASTATELVSDILDDAQKLAQQQFSMLKAELREDLNRVGRAAGYGSLGIAMLTVGGLTLVAFLVNLLHEQFAFSMWASCLIIGGLLCAGGVAFAFAARNLFDNFNPLPDKTINTIQENLTWNNQPQT